MRHISGGLRAIPLPPPIGPPSDAGTGALQNAASAMTGEQGRPAVLHFPVTFPSVVHWRGEPKSPARLDFLAAKQTGRFLSVLSFWAVDTQKGQPYNPPR
jgi:hypothetical protein